MIIKKFQAKTEKEAVEAAKAELGGGIVIMNVKQVKRKGLFRLFLPTLTEVTVALEEEKERPAVALKEPSTPIVPEAVWNQKRETPTPPAEVQSSEVIEEKLSSLESLLQQQLKKQESEEKKEEEPEKEEARSETETFLKLLYNTMVDNEIREVYANQIIDELELAGNPNMQMDFALSAIYQKMILKFGQASIIRESEKKPKVIFFVGSTGVGKTTTIAKIASKFCVEDKKKVALLTTDTYRIAAAEQLRTYANILEVPFRVIYTPQEVAQAVEEFRKYDYILVDTAGHSHKNAEQNAAVREIITAVEEQIEKEVYLVVSATTKYRDLISIANAYRQITDYKLIFTKLDETSVWGNLLNLRLYTGAPLAYVTYGQNVPDDIEVFNPQTTVKKILSGSWD
ncbi:MAG: flagellar biosynthesis protein FlhF [Lachnospiraceae bacterium]|nr:flagellar biosynthesis protein FlhF [Lachnospiraceae bacterium]